MVSYFIVNVTIMSLKGNLTTSVQYNNSIIVYYKLNGGEHMCFNGLCRKGKRGTEFSIQIIISNVVLVCG